MFVVTLSDAKIKMAFFSCVFGVPAITLFNIFISNHTIQEAHALQPSFVQPTDNTPVSRSPRYISVRMKTPLQTLIAGETGSFELEAVLKKPENSSQQHPLWDRKAAIPLVIWISSPDDSGIAFIDKIHPERPRHHILVKFTHPPEDDSEPLTAHVEYRVKPRTRAGNHSFWMDIYGALITAEGNKIQDTGITRLPFGVVPTLEQNC